MIGNVNGVNFEMNSEQKAHFLANLPIETQMNGYIIPKSLPWRRMSEDEAAAVTAIMSFATPRQRAIYDAAQEIDTSDELYGILTGLLSTALSPARAAELLERA